MLAAMVDVRHDVVEDAELLRLKRDYLPMWAERDSGVSVGSGFPTDVPYRDYMKPHYSGSYDPDPLPDPWVSRLIDAAIDELTGTGGFGLARAALSVRYMSARLPSVIRSGRLTQMECEEIEDLADRAELALVPIVKRRGLPL